MKFYSILTNYYKISFLNKYGFIIRQQKAIKNLEKLILEAIYL